jgi:hypothetical protein
MLPEVEENPPNEGGFTEEAPKASENRQKTKSHKVEAESKGNRYKTLNVISPDEMKKTFLLRSEESLRISSRATNSLKPDKDGVEYPGLRDLTTELGGVSLSSGLCQNIWSSSLVPVPTTRTRRWVGLSPRCAIGSSQKIHTPHAAFNARRDWQQLT